ncbi:MAG: hypothetical protein CMN75_11045 [Spirochaeta sp.]|nr:hypothetical protein [Spirochaeta sp.]
MQSSNQVPDQVSWANPVDEPFPSSLDGVSLTALPVKSGFILTPRSPWGYFFCTGTSDTGRFAAVQTRNEDFSE